MITPETLVALRDVLARRGLGEDLLRDLVAALQGSASEATIRDPEQGGEAPPALPALGRYEDLGLLGRGGVGEVRRVRDPVLQRTMALKRLVERYRDDADAVARFVEEARITAGLQHPGVIPVHELWSLPDGSHYFTMQEVRGRTLREVIVEVHAAVHDGEWTPARSGWTLWRLVDTLRRVCETVAYAHDLGVIHRDLKPGNVMVGAYGEVLVLDWGLARARGSSDEGAPRAEAPRSDRPETVLGWISGTPGYMAPEQAEGRRAELGPAVDVYALGAVLAVMLTGRPPDGPELPAAGAGGAPTPEDLRAIARRALAPTPEDRYPGAGAMAEALAAWLEGARRREVALGHVEGSDLARSRAEGLASEAARLRARADLLLEATRPWDPVDVKAPAWALQDEAARLDLAAALAGLQETELLAAALTEVPDLALAHERLADHYQRNHREAEARRDPLASARYEALLATHDRGRHRAWLSGEGRLTLVTDPPGARALLYRYQTERRRLVPVFERELGLTPLVELPLKRGSYLVILRAEGRLELRLPLCVGRGEHVSGVRPGDDAPLPIPLLASGELGADEVYVPPGWYQSGDVELTAGQLPSRSIWLDGFVIRRFPVTHRELLAAADALAAEGHPERALAFLPWSKALRGPAYARGLDGRYTILPDEDGDLWDPDWPAFLVDWGRARAYAAWLADRTGLPWRLPSELEWEKAARGADGRLFPWGDFADPTWANLRQSEPGDRPLPRPVFAFPTDVSPYGVRGLAGGVVDWCLDVFEAAGPPLRDGVLDLDAVLASTAQEGAPRAVRGGAFSYYEGGARIGRRVGQAPGFQHVNCGFRLARSFPSRREGG